MIPPNHALQRIRPSRSVCNPCSPWTRVARLGSLGQTLATMRDMPTARGPQQRDVLCSGAKMFLFWCLPSFAFALGFFVSPGLKTVLWTLSLGFMGTVCLLNASRCGRIHCYFTGPFFIVAAVTSLGYGIGLLPFGPSGWKWIGDITIIGAIVLSCIPEIVLGRYRRNGPDVV